jgi:hypothetical protein
VCRVILASGPFRPKTGGPMTGENTWASLAQNTLTSIARKMTCCAY